MPDRSNFFPQSQQAAARTEKMPKTNNKKRKPSGGHEARTKKRGPSTSLSETPADVSVKLESATPDRILVTMDKVWEDKILGRVGINDPVMLVSWNVDNLGQTVQALQGHAAGPALAHPPPAWLAAPYSAETVQDQILQHLIDSAKGVHPDDEGGENDHVGGTVGHVMIAPNSYLGYTTLNVLANNMGLDPFFMNHATLPLGETYSIADGKRKTTGVRAPLVAPPGGVGVLD